MNENYSLLAINDSDGNIQRKAKAICTVTFDSAIDYQNMCSDGSCKECWRISALSCASWLAKSIGGGLVFCHPRGIDNLNIDISMEPGVITFIANVSGMGVVGINMEAYGAALGAALGAIDMIRKLDPKVQIKECRLVDA